MTYMLVAAALGLAAWYLTHVNTAMKRVPEESLALTPNRWTAEEIKAAYKKTIESPVDVEKSIPPKQSRRYVVVGGSGLVGGWIVQHLLSRGESPSAIRILDLLAPTEEIIQLGVRYIKTNITDELAVNTAFEEPWPESVAQLPLSVFHTAAIIRFQDRIKSLMYLHNRVNVNGTRYLLNAAKKHGASCFISTSSGSISLQSPSFWIAPWAKLPTRIAQIINDSIPLPQRHEDFFSNYAVSKVEAQQMVCSADDLASNFRTGCIRPANGIYGIGSDASMSITGTYLRRGTSPSWLHQVIQSFVNAENVSIAHLLYEQRVLEYKPGPSPYIGGQSFVVTDPNPAITFGDLYLLLNTLSKTPVAFPPVQPIFMLVLAHVLEFYTYAQLALPWLLPVITGDLAQIQPSLFAISNTFCVADDARARKSPEQGGLGYNPPLTTMDGLCKQLLDWNRKVPKEVKEEEVTVGPLRVTEKGVDVNVVAPVKKV